MVLARRFREGAQRRAAIAKHLEHGVEDTCRALYQVHIYPINGAAQRVGKSDTAFSYRDANFALVIVGIDPDPANEEPRSRRGARTTSTPCIPYSAGGAYVNFMMEEGQERVAAAFRDNYARLAQIKRTYDPTNFFRVNQNIQPAAL